MSKKNIARTPLEGGRREYNKWERRNSSRVERRQMNQQLNRFAIDAEESDFLPFPKRRPVDQVFTDKLSAPGRWLAKNITGFHVRDVRGFLLNRFDTRTLAGRHIVYDHMMPSQDWTGVWRIYMGDLYVDDDLIVRARQRTSRKKRYPRKDRLETHYWISSLNKSYRVGLHNNVLHLFEPVKELQKLPYTESVITVTTYRPIRKLSERENELWQVYLTHRGFPRLALDRNS